MEIFKKRKLSPFATVLASFAWVVFASVPAMADDTEIFFGQANDLSNNNPNVLLIIDSSGSMDDPVAGDTRDRLQVVQDVANELVANMTGVNVGLMKFDYWGNRSNTTERDSQGGMVVHPISDVVANLTTLQDRIDDIHHHGWTPLSETYYEAAAYYMGLDLEYGDSSYEGYVDRRGRNREKSLKSHSDTYSNGVYDSPITGACQRNYIIYLSDGFPTMDTEAEGEIEDLLTDTAYGAQTATSCANDHGDQDGMCIDELAEFLYENDLSPLPGKQNIISHFIGFALDLPIFEAAAEKGNGTYYQANNADELRTKLTELLNTVADTEDGFTAPAVTVNAFDRTSHLNQLYFTVFKPGDSTRWDGNLKKYKFSPETNGDGLEIVGQDGQAAVDPISGFFYNGRNDNGEIDPNKPKAWSFWSAAPDGADVTAGGAAGLIGLGRNILTNPGGNAGSLSQLDSVNALDDFLEDFATEAANGTLGQAGSVVEDLLGDSVQALGLDTFIPELTAEQWKDWAAGVDVNDANGDGQTVDARQQIGAPLHSKPSVVVYGGSGSAPDVTLFVGTNDGYLHAIDGSTGLERWAFMPKDLWGNIPLLAENKPFAGQVPYGIDGHIAINKSDGGDGSIDAGSDFVHLVFGMRRGGNHYYSMDVTNPDSPSLMWKFNTKGQSWARPVFAKINLGTDSAPDARDVVIISHGYNPAQDDASGYLKDNGKGNRISIIDASSGNELYRLGKSSWNNGPSLALSEMKNSFPSAVRPLDMDLDGYVDRIYANDVAGKLFRFDVHNDDDATQRITGGVIASVGGAESGGASENRRFYYSPDIALGSDNGTQFLTITMSSGFRAHPLDSGINDYLIGVRDYNPFGRLGADPLTVDQDYDYGATIATMQNLGYGDTVTINDGVKGWYRALPGSGEKSLAGSRIFQNKAYYTTYTPGAAPDGNPCAPALGTGKLVTINLTSGAVEETTLQKPGIPPEITFLFGETDSVDNANTCFGNGCDSHPVDPNDPDNPIDPNVNGNEGAAGERKVECLAGPEACIADSAELPQRTFWRQSDTN